ncbi:hypothetical protein [Brevibacillus sp. SAFN-007a]|uniref:hypothetical protein n=1 Tax=Brevibacillus sp. SAFN-007a TaxID=3436862 RepID=UPI003F7E33CE
MEDILSIATGIAGFMICKDSFTKQEQPLVFKHLLVEYVVTVGFCYLCKWALLAGSTALELFSI